MFENLRRDAAKYRVLGGWLSHPGFWIVAVYRLGVWAASMPSAFLRLPAWALYRMARFPLRHLFNVDFWAGSRGARIGAGLCLIHPHNVIIAAGVEIGEDCLIFHDVTLGKGPAPGVPKIGKNVDIYVGARILGGISIGDDCMVGANCVVTQNVPARSVVVPPPVRIIPRSLSPRAGLADRQAAPEENPAPPGSGS
jgi:serine O-acetyltransferase